MFRSFTQNTYVKYMELCKARKDVQLAECMRLLGDLCVLGRTRDHSGGLRGKVGQPVPFSLQLIPIINLLLPDEPIRYPRPATQGAIYLID